MLIFRLVKLGDGRWGKKIFFFNRFRSVSGLRLKKNFDIQTVKIVKLGGVKEGGGREKIFVFNRFRSDSGP